MRDFRELRIWERSMELAEKIYEVTKRFPKSEIYGLTSQLRRAVVSISSNIAEGCGRRTSKDFVGFLYNAMGSVREVESQLILSGRVGYLEEDEVKNLVGDFEELIRMLARFIEFVLSESVE
ncbi:MAG: four helix bundle protein [Nanoarchaeota archaeon]|nr:four helix bundle protein [Nanoarchaeota archaeon]